MGIKSKFLGFVAAAALLFSMSVVVSAQEAVNGSVQLEGDVCGLAVTSGNSITLGNWKWNGSKYVLGSSPGTNQARISGNTTSFGPNGCNITLKSNGLRRGTSDDWIRGTNFSSRIIAVGKDHGWDPVVDETVSKVYKNIPKTTFHLDLRLNEVPDDIQPGKYEGTVTFTISNAGQP